jgi:hypothetical protein
MKHIVRASVLTLAFAGAAAGVLAAHSAKAQTSIMTVQTVSALPVPNCNPGTNNGCDIQKGR